MRFIIDAQLPPALALRLATAGHTAEHVTEIGLDAAADVEIWTHALKVRAVIVSKDQDFAERAIHDVTGAQVVWIRFGNTTNTALWMALEPKLPEIIDALAAGERLIEIV